MVYAMDAMRILGLRRKLKRRQNLEELTSLSNSGDLTVRRS
jgi:hypothetical protein